MPVGICEQVVEHLDDAEPVHNHPGQVRWNVDVQVVPASDAQEGVSRLVHQDSYVHGFGGDLQRARLDVRHVQQVAYQLAHPFGLRVDYPVELERLGEATPALGIGLTT